MSNVKVSLTPRSTMQTRLKRSSAECSRNRRYRSSRFLMSDGLFESKACSGDLAIRSTNAVRVELEELSGDTTERVGVPNRAGMYHLCLEPMHYCSAALIGLP